MHRQEKNKFNKEKVLWPHTPERSLWLCLAHGSTGLLAAKDKGTTDPSLGYRGRLRGSLLVSEAQLSKRPCQSCRDQGQGPQHPFFHQRGGCSPNRRWAAGAAKKTEALAGKAVPVSRLQLLSQNTTAWGSNSRLTVQEAGRPNIRVRSEASWFVDGHLAAHVVERVTVKSPIPECGPASRLLILTASQKPVS